MFDLKIHRHFGEDILELKRTDPAAAAEIRVHLEELKGDQEKLATLLEHDHGADQTANYHVSWWWAQWKMEKRDLWRTKIWCIENRRSKYRLIYAYIKATRTFVFLAIAPRSFDYEADHYISRRVIDDYDRLTNNQ